MTFNNQNQVNVLLEKLLLNNIRYCHFKSNLHVEASVRGQTDLDILVDKLQYEQATALLAHSGFKRFSPKLPASYPAVEDWIGFDPKDGQLFHLHLHWEMTAGEPHLKGYRIPWEKEILGSRQLDHNSQIYTSSPEVELLLLLVRAALKLRLRDRLKYCFGKNYPAPNGDIQKEFAWLTQRVNHSKLNELAYRLLDKSLAEQVMKLAELAALDSTTFMPFAKKVKIFFAPNQSYSLFTANIYRWFREVYSKLTHKLNNHLGSNIIRRRVPATGGLMIAFMGVDGAGKSTQVKEMVQWLGWKTDICRIYFGSGDGPVSLLRKPLVLLQKLKTAKKTHATTPSQGFDVSVKQRGLTSILFQAAWATALAGEKKQRVKQAVRLRNRGMIVICDRYPQQQIIGFNDGPLLAHWRTDTGILGWLARYEASVFDMVERIAPDMVFKLHLDAQTSYNRKPDTRPEMIQKKIDAVAGLSFPRATVIDIDASQPLSTVSLTIKQRIWEHI